MFSNTCYDGTWDELFFLDQLVALKTGRGKKDIANFFFSKTRSRENVRDPKNSIRKLLALVEREERKVFDFL